MNERQRSKRARFLTRLRKRGCARHTVFCSYDLGGSKQKAYTVTSLILVSKSGKYIPLNIKFDVIP